MLRSIGAFSDDANPTYADLKHEAMYLDSQGKLLTAAPNMCVACGKLLSDGSYGLMIANDNSVCVCLDCANTKQLSHLNCKVELYAFGRDN